MNRIFRVIWNTTLEVYQAVSEVGKGRKKTKASNRDSAPSLISVGALLLISHSVFAADLPTNGSIVSGQVAIEQQANVMNITQSTNKAAVNWQSFDVGKNNTVNFIQPSASSAILNRVIGSDVSSIQGAINANGQVFLINPNGVLFTPNAQVNVGAMVASTLNISNEDFNDGNYVFAGDSSSAIINQGNIQTADGGYVAFIAARIENIGSITANDGQVLMGAGAKVTLDMGGPVKLEVEQGAIDALIANGGAIQADGGMVYLSAKAAGDLASSVINHSGIIEASSLSSVGGEIILEGDNISLAAGSELNASGAAGGGDILVGGDWQGTGDMRQAVSVDMAATASIDASATQKGDGGKVVLWSDIHNAESVTSVSGHITAKAGVDGGDGGKIETSGKLLVTDGVTGSASSTLGKSGLWLFDPYNIEIVSSNNANGSFNSGTWTASADTSTILNTNINNLLNAGTSVLVDTTGAGSQAGSITVSAPITKSSGAETTLTLKASESIGIRESITSSSGKLNVVLWSDTDGLGNTGTNVGSVGLSTGKNITTNGGHLWVGGGSGSNTWNTLNVGDGAATASDAAGTWNAITWAGSVNTVGTNGDDGSLYMAGATAETSAGAFDIGFAYNNNSQINTGTGDIELHGDEIGFAGENGTYTTTLTTTGKLTIAPWEEFFQNNNAASSTAFTWNGALNGSDFEGSDSIAGLTINGVSNLDGLTIGKAESTTNSNVFLNSDISINGSVNIFADDFFSTGSITTSNNGNILLKGQGYVVIDPNNNLSTDGGDITLWSNAVNTTTGAENNEVDLRGNNTLSSNGGNIILAGGLDDGSNGGTANDGIADGYAYRGYNNTIFAADFGGGVILDSSSATNGGDIIIRGSGYGEGVKSVGTLKIDSGTGTITIDGKSTQDNGVEFNGDAIAITTENTTSDAINITGTTTGTGKYGVVLGSGGTNSRNTLIQATGANGGITIAGTSAYSIGLYGTERGVLQVLAESGDITLSGQNQAGSTGEADADFRNGVGDNNVLFYLGNRKDATVVNGVTSLVVGSSSNIKLQADFLSWGTNEPVINTSGVFTVESVSDSFSTLQNAKTSWFTFTNIGGLTIGKSTNVQNVTVNEDLAVAGDVNLFGKDIAINANLDTSSAAGGDILLKASGNIITADTKDITTDGGDITLWSDSDSSTAGYIQIGDQSDLSSSGGDITLSGGSNLLTGFAYGGGTSHGISIGKDNANANSINSSGGDILIRGYALTDNDANNLRGALLFSGVSIDSGVGSLSIVGKSEDSYGINLSSENAGITLKSAKTSGTAITVDGWSDKSYGLVFDYANNKQVLATGGGDIAISGVATTADNGLFLQGIDVLAASGKITLDGGARGIKKAGSQISIGSKAGDVNVASSSSDIDIIGDVLNLGISTKFNTSGKLSLSSSSDSFSSAISSSDFDLQSTLTGLTIGKPTNTANVTIASATTITGPITLYGGDITINDKLEATNSTITLDGSGAVTDGASGYVVANNLALLDGTITLDNVLNTVTNLAASGTDAISFINSGALNLSTIGATNGLTSTGAIDVATKTGNLTVSQNVTGTGIVLNAGKDTAAGTATGGNIIISSSPTFTASTGNAVLYSGDISDSTGLTALVDSGKFRYNSDETATNFTNALSATGVFAVYREQPSATGTISSATITYGAANPSFSLNGGGGLVNGDSASGFTIDSAANSGAGKLKADTYTVTASGLSDLGYSVSGVTNGALTVNKKDLNVTGLTTNDRVYNATQVATLGGAASVSALASDVVSLDGTAAGAFADKNVDSDKVVTITGNTLSGADAANYNLLQQTGLTADITKADLAVSGLSTSDRVYDATDIAGLTGTAAITILGSDTVNLGGTAAGKFADKNVGTDKAVTVTGNTISGADVGNYNLVQQVGLEADITQADLFVSGLGASDKVYDGTDIAGLTGTAVITALGSDTLTLGGAAVGKFADKNVGVNKTVTLPGITVNGADAANYNLVQPSLTADITKANLNVTANDSAKFLAEGDPSFTVSYAGFVNGETVTELNGVLAVTRVGADTVAGTYEDVIQASGYSAGNYAITYQHGDFTIVGSDQLLVNVTNIADEYGNDTQYSVASAQYENSGTIYTLGTGGITGSSVIIDANNLVTIDDGSGGTARFNLDPKSASLSTANKLEVGAYQLGISGNVTENSGNFNDAIVVTGAHQVNAKGLTANTTGGISKVYDGSVGLNDLGVDLTGLVVNDLVTVTGVGELASKNVGSGLNYTVSNLNLSNTDADNYYLTGGTSFTGNNAEVTAKEINVAYGAVDKTYDGSSIATVLESTSDIIAGDTVTFTETAAFVDKNVANDKTVNISNIAISGGDAGNYTLSNTTAVATADITRLASVTWIGGATGNWFDPANWAGGAVPDVSNVANVVIPQGVTVSFDTSGAQAPADATAAVNVDSIGVEGSLAQNSGTLNVGSGGLTLDSYAQSGGALAVSGDVNLKDFTQSGGEMAVDQDFTVSENFEQGANGTLTVGGNADITDDSGGLVVGNLNVTGTTSMTSTDGDITQAAGTTIVVGGATTLTASDGTGTDFDITLDGTTNDFQGVVSATGKDITLADTNDLDVVLNASGDSTLTADGNLTVSGSTNDLTTTTTNGGNTTFGANTIDGALTTISEGDVTQTGAITVADDTSILAGKNDIVLDNKGNIFNGRVTYQGGTVSLSGVENVLVESAISRIKTQMPAAARIDASLNRTSLNYAFNQSANAGGGINMVVVEQEGDGSTDNGAPNDNAAVYNPGQVNVFVVNGGVKMPDAILNVLSSEQ